MKNFLLEKYHFYSLGFNIKKKLKINQSGRSIYLLRHFLHLPSLTDEHINSLRVVTCKESEKDGIEFLNPLWIGSSYICIEQRNFTWFQEKYNFHTNSPILIYDCLSVSAVLIQPR